MNGVLLDTHALVWAATDPTRLGTKAKSLIEDPISQLLVSAASAWELSTKVRLGRFPEAEPLVSQYVEIVEALGATHLPVRAEHALRAGGLTWTHRDPFDRILAAQGLLEHATLVTRDTAFGKLGGLTVVW